MPPAASTSAAQLPGFRTSRPRRSAAAVATRANHLLANSLPPPLSSPAKRPGKGTARAREGYDDQSYDEEDYAPRAGQVQRRRRVGGRLDKGKKRAREEGSEGSTSGGGEGVTVPRKRARKGEGQAAQLSQGEARAQEEDEADEAAMEAAYERMDAKRARKKAHKDEKRAEQLAQARAREALEDEAASQQSPLSLSGPGRARARATKRVQFAGLAASAAGSDSDAGGETDERALDDGDGADDGGFAQLVLDDVDLADPMLIPSAERRRGKRFWRALEHGVYCSALYDVAQGETHLGRALVQWEGLRRAREVEEREEQARVDAALSDEERATSSKKAPHQRLTGLRVHDPRRSVLPVHMGLANDDADAESTRLRRKFDDDGHELLPLPTSLALARMARWPQHPSSLPDARTSTSSSLSLEDALLASYERAQRASQNGPSLPEPTTPCARSAYAADGPFAFLDDTTSPAPDLEDDLPPPHDPFSDVPDPLEWSTAPPQLAALPSLLSSLLVRLTDCVPKAPLPAPDLRSAWARAEEMARDDRRRGLDRDRAAVGWEEVVAVARAGGVKESIVDTLEAQLVALFGPSSRPRASLPLPFSLLTPSLTHSPTSCRPAAVVLPPEGNPTILRLKSRKPTLVRTKPKKRSAVHVLKRASASVSRRGGNAGGGEGGRARERELTAEEEEGESGSDGTA
ncbi:hypothetical protein JCM8208_006225 [Rhodotorula glutinis]